MVLLFSSHLGEAVLEMSVDACDMTVTGGSDHAAANADQKSMNGFLGRECSLGLAR